MKSALAYIALGSNLDEPMRQVQSARHALAGLSETELVKCSSLYRTAPVGNTAQPDFINAVCSVRTRLTPEALLAALFAIEQAHGRVRTPDNVGGPRRLDLDLLLYEGAIRNTATLTLPHPRLHERAFVLYPLAEIAPSCEIPGRGRAAALQRACAGQTIERLAS